MKTKYHLVNTILLGLFHIILISLVTEKSAASEKLFLSNDKSIDYYYIIALKYINQIS